MLANYFTAVLTFRLTVIIAAVFARRSCRTPCSAATYRPFIDVLVTFFTTDHHDANLQKTDGCVFFSVYELKTY